MSSSLSDAEIVIQARTQSDAFTLLIDRYEAPITRYVSRLIGDDHESVEEIVQEVFIKMYRGIHGYKPHLKFSSWLYRIAHNVCVDYLRKHHREEHTSLDLEDDESRTLIEKIASSENISGSFAREEVQKAVRSLVTSLPEKYRTPLILAYLEEKSYEEISDILEMPINTVGTLISRAKKHFSALASEPHFSHLFSYDQPPR